MMIELTDEESVAHADKQVERVADAMVATCSRYPGTSIEALSQVLYMVNGANWICASDMARARVRAKAMGAVP
jgi:hypothetical protein